MDYRGTPISWGIRRLAYHEAGHAVVARALGIRVVRIEAPHQPPARWQTWYAPVPPTRAGALRGLIVATAGACCERLHGLYPPITYTADGRARLAGFTSDAEDVREILGWCLRLHPNFPECLRYWIYAIRRARHILTRPKHAAAVAAIAGALQRVEMLSGPALDRLIAEAWGTPLPSESESA